ncbi:MAG: hypothetical protein HOO96_18130 [Polyangiaceae bacterium]|nr:hypothetical protein [Polyangiaceae bacterium]
MAGQSSRVLRIVELVDALDEEERQELKATLLADERARGPVEHLVEAMPARSESIAERHAEIATRAARVRAGAPTLPLDAVDGELRADLDF